MRKPQQEKPVEPAATESKDDEDPAKAEEQQQKEKKEEVQEIEKSAEKTADKIEDTEAAAKVEEQQKEHVAKVEAGAQRPWLEKWAGFEKATRDITNWDFKDGMFRHRFGIRFELDLTAGNSSNQIEQAVGPIKESANFRRAALFADGDIARRYHFRFEYDFGIDKGLKDAYIDNLFRYKLKVVAFRIGHFKEPFSLGRMTSDNFGGFLERSLVVDTIAPGRNPGIAVYGSHLKARLAWTFGAFTHGKTTDDNPGSSDLTFTGRLTALPSYRDEGKHLVHLGLSASLRSPKGDAVAYTTRPEARFVPNFLDTGKLSASRLV